jgi:integrase/recombinase XerD
MQIRPKADSFYKRVAEKHGLHVAQNLSGNVSIKEIFRYTKPDSNQKHDMVQNLLCQFSYKLPQ